MESHLLEILHRSTRTFMVYTKHIRLTTMLKLPPSILVCSPHFNLTCPASCTQPQIQIELQGNGRCTRLDGVFVDPGGSANKYDV